MIITVSREFGSGGRELGKRLADVLAIPYYDKAIVTLLAQEHGFDESYVAHMTEKKIQTAYPLTIGRQFTTSFDYTTKQSVQILVEQQKIIERLAKAGDCIIVGRCADIILKDFSPFNIFVYASMIAKLKRCQEYAAAEENLTEAELKRKMREVDKNRAAYRSFYTDAKWGAKENYHLCINTTGSVIKNLVPPLAEYIKYWFANHA